MGEKGSGITAAAAPPFFHPSKEISVSEMTGMFFFPPKITPNLFFPPISAHNHELPRLPGGQHGFSASDVLPHTESYREQSSKAASCSFPCCPWHLHREPSEAPYCMPQCCGPVDLHDECRWRFGWQAKGQSVLDGLLRPAGVVRPEMIYSDPFN